MSTHSEETINLLNELGCEYWVKTQGIRDELINFIPAFCFIDTDNSLFLDETDSYIEAFGMARFKFSISDLTFAHISEEDINKWALSCATHGAYLKYDKHEQKILELHIFNPQMADLVRALIIGKINDHKSLLACQVLVKAENEKLSDLLEAAKDAMVLSSEVATKLTHQSAVMRDFAKEQNLYVYQTLPPYLEDLIDYLREHDEFISWEAFSKIYFKFFPKGNSTDTSHINIPGIDGQPSLWGYVMYSPKGK